ncbi:enoyl-CoA hydratase/isomerase family protein [bacterium]|nr:enoyl-CoA hydratase/isomerase family protein [bacterium]
MADDVYQLELSAPGRNALSSDHMQRLVGALRDAGGRPLLLTGAGGAFSAGLNLKEVASLDVCAMARFLCLLDTLVQALYEYPGPTVACIDGHAIAGGCVLALCCDWRVAVDRADVRIGLNEVALGLEFPPMIMNLVRDRLPRRHLERVLLEAGLHDPRTACQLGLVDEVAADPLPAAQAAVARLAGVPRATYQATKRTLRHGVLTLSDGQLRHFHEEVVPSWCTPEAKERISAALRR